ncbi:hypothetical protein [Streptomyces sp. NPDC017260]
MTDGPDGSCADSDPDGSCADSDLAETADADVHIIDAVLTLRS